MALRVSTGTCDCNGRPFCSSVSSAVFVVHLRRQPTKRAGPEERGRTESKGGWQGASESAVSAKLGLVLCLARNRRHPKRPSEPRPSGVHPEEDAVEKRRAAYRLSLCTRQ